MPPSAPIHFDTISRSWKLKWPKIGEALRESAIDAHGYLPPLEIAYSFLLDNPECFSDWDEWPTNMPQEPPDALKQAYFGFEAEYQSINRHQRFHRHDAVGKVIATAVLVWIGVRVIRGLYSR